MRDWMRWQRVRLGWWRTRTAEKAALAIVWRLPHWLVYWAYIRVMANATSGAGAVPVDGASFDVAAKAWLSRRGGDRSFA